MFINIIYSHECHITLSFIFSFALIFRCGKIVGLPLHTKSNRDGLFMIANQVVPGFERISYQQQCWKNHTHPFPYCRTIIKNRRIGKLARPAYSLEIV